MNITCDHYMSPSGHQLRSCKMCGEALASEVFPDSFGTHNADITWESWNILKCYCRNLHIWHVGIGSQLRRIISCVARLEWDALSVTSWPASFPKSQTIPSELARRQPTLRSFRWSCVVDMVCRSCFLGSTWGRLLPKDDLSESLSSHPDGAGCWNLIPAKDASVAAWWLQGWRSVQRSQQPNFPSVSKRAVTIVTVQEFHSGKDFQSLKMLHSESSSPPEIGATFGIWKNFSSDQGQASQARFAGKKKPVSLLHPVA